MEGRASDPAAWPEPFRPVEPDHEPTNGWVGRRPFFVRADPEATLSAAARVLIRLPIVLLLLLSVSTAAQAYIEPPILKEQVEAGKLPAIVDRLPKAPLVVQLGAQGLEPGDYGGDLRILMSGAKDVRMMVVYGYARLVGYDRNFTLEPDILESFEVEQGRIFTFHLRPGHRWSDGKPFTAEDFRYFWEDVANNPELSPSGIPTETDGRGRSAEIRSYRPGHGALFVVQAKPKFPSGIGRRFSAVYLPTRALSEAIPRPLCRSG